MTGRPFSGTVTVPQTAKLASYLSRIKVVECDAHHAPPGRPLEVLMHTPVSRGAVGKVDTMWVFDGEQWTEEGKSESSARPEQSVRYDESMPELQVIEIVPVPTIPNYIPFPLP